MGGAERAEPLMERTYVILRRYLNRMPAPAMLEVKEEWPFLFSQRGLFSHFGLLTDVNILQKLQEALGQRGQTILQFCQKLDNPKIREVLASYDPEASEKAACILLLLMVYFKEPTEKLMLEVDTCATAALPSTPCLIIQGNVMFRDLIFPVYTGFPAFLT
ncbi:Sterile alpha motif domain containing protein 3 [Dissostichus eleginoides]|uniref:Sterile alpha motif domain containing protein 3 n=1 Tax=Dissostichus eleginoides TaxID=100907 RepID=A0AAD9BYR1_DISEL|nr:Sterile alpha motif domain containing protein 3 [Dissostichus eleginoides]